MHEPSDLCCTLCPNIAPRCRAECLRAIRAKTYRWTLRHPSRRYQRCGTLPSLRLLPSPPPRTQPTPSNPNFDHHLNSALRVCEPACLHQRVLCSSTRADPASPLVSRVRSRGASEQAAAGLEQGCRQRCCKWCGRVVSV